MNESVSFASIALATVFFVCLASFSYAATYPYELSVDGGNRNFATSTTDTSTRGDFVKVVSDCGKAFSLPNGDKASVLYYVTGNAGGKAKLDKIFYQTEPATSSTLTRSNSRSSALCGLFKK